MQATMLKTMLAERILKFAAEGERNFELLAGCGAKGPCRKGGGFLPRTSA
jgi:hypothetical protein